MNIIGIIPARMASSRLPNKPMAEILGMPMIGHCYKRSKMSNLLDEVYVATCDKEIVDYIAKDGNLLKPYNFPEGTPGLGFNIYKTAKDESIMVINLIGNVFMKPDDNPFLKVEEIMRKHRLGSELKFIFVDFHAEATSEKVAMGHHLDGRVSAVVGTHQHIPTADGHILSGGTAYQTDAGMCGDYNSIIGMNKEPILERFLGMKSKSKFSPALGEATLCGVVIESDLETGLAKTIEPIKIGGVLGK